MSSFYGEQTKQDDHPPVLFLSHSLSGAFPSVLAPPSPPLPPPASSPHPLPASAATSFNFLVTIFLSLSPRTVHHLLFCECSGAKSNKKPTATSYRFSSLLVLFIPHTFLTHDGRQHAFLLCRYPHHGAPASMSSRSYLPGPGTPIYLFFFIFRRLHLQVIHHNNAQYWVRTHSLPSPVDGNS